MSRTDFDKNLIAASENALQSSLQAKRVDGKQLPLILSGRYDIFTCTHEDGRRLLLLCLKSDNPIMVRQIVGNCAWASDLLKQPAVFVTRTLERYKRARLRKQHVNFIVPDVEIHLPSWGMVRTNYVPQEKRVRDGIGLAAQRILLAHFNHLFPGDITLTSVRQLLGFSKITTIAAFNEMEKSDLAQREAIPGQRGQRLSFPLSGRLLWDHVRPLLKSPVRSKIGVDELPAGLTLIPSGETALANISMLNPPQQEVLAFYGSAADTAKLKKKAVPADDGTYLVELWKHPPLLPGLNNLDPLTTLITTFDIANDPRVEGEHEDILENFKW